MKFIAGLLVGLLVAQAWRAVPFLLRRRVVVKPVVPVIEGEPTHGWLVLNTTTIGDLWDDLRRSGLRVTLFNLREYWRMDRENHLRPD